MDNGGYIKNVKNGPDIFDYAFRHLAITEMKKAKNDSLFLSKMFFLKQ